MAEADRGRLVKMVEGSLSERWVCTQPRDTAQGERGMAAGTLSVLYPENQAALMLEGITAMDSCAHLTKRLVYGVRQAS